VLAGLDIAEKRAAQDGSFTWLPPATGNSRSKVRPYDVRVATLPVRYGERITMRLLETGNSRIQLNDLGLCDEHNAQLISVLARPHGLVLLTGPTGSGKTTTLYAAIQHLLETASLNILTVEDPIEYETEGISQVEVDSSDKVNVAKALRSLLRHDPDVVMIGEIRDAESLDAAVKAALTGHLVLSTLHTNDAPSAVTRLRDMGLEPHLIAATLRLSVAQRLVRRLCPECAEKYALTQAEANSLGRPELVGSDAYKPCGCLACSGRGYVGRVGLFEFMLPTAKLSEQIAADAPLVELIAQMKEEQHRLLIDDGIAKSQAGVTTVAEAMTAIDSGR
jgi:type IV pilus assembly protein PilB